MMLVLIYVKNTQEGEGRQRDRMLVLGALTKRYE